MGDRDLPRPSSLYRQKVDVDVLRGIRLTLINVFKLGLDGELIEDRIVLFHLELFPE